MQFGAKEYGRFKPNVVSTAVGSSLLQPAPAEDHERTEVDSCMTGWRRPVSIYGARPAPRIPERCSDIVQRPPQRTVVTTGPTAIEIVSRTMVVYHPNRWFRKEVSR